MRRKRFKKILMDQEGDSNARFRFYLPNVINPKACMHVCLHTEAIQPL